jgi:hypothetical protein
LVVRDDGVHYLASPMGRTPATVFHLVVCEDRKAVFENPEHDFPQRIIYWQPEAGILCARIEGTEAGQAKASEWQWGRVQTKDIPAP